MNEKSKKSASRSDQEKWKNEFEAKRQRYREWLKKNPPIFDENTEQEMKECQGCYCQLPAGNLYYDFCSGCLGCKSLGCELGCCDCYSDGSRGWKGANGKIAKGSHRGKQKTLTPYQEQRLNLEMLKLKIEDLIEEVKNKEDSDDMLTAKRIEDARRWNEQSKQRILKDLTISELVEEFRKRNPQEIDKHNENLRNSWTKK